LCASGIPKSYDRWNRVQINFGIANESQKYQQAAKQLLKFWDLMKTKKAPLDAFFELYVF
jgi:hypothetical protein